MGHAQQLSTACAGSDHGSRCYHASGVGTAAARVSTWISTCTNELVARLRLVIQHILRAPSSAFM